VDDLHSVITHRKLSPQNVALFLSAVAVLRDLDLLENEYGGTVEGKGERLELFYNADDEDCRRLVAALEAKGMAVEPPTYETGWAQIRTGADFSPLVSQTVIDAYLEAMARGPRGRPWPALVASFGGAAVAAGILLWLLVSPEAHGGLGGLVAPVMGLLAIAALGLGAWGASLTQAD
jgi:hypothetical protein